MSIDNNLSVKFVFPLKCFFGNVKSTVLQMKCLIDHAESSRRSFALLLAFEIGTVRIDYRSLNDVCFSWICIICQVIYSQFGLAIHQDDHQARRRFIEWAQNEIAVVPDFHKRILFSDKAHFWLNGYVNKQNCRIWSEANSQVYVETPLHPEKLTV
ncbi:hypothetical protein TNCV_4123601 [Trichonephila clavipes]|nr:hypothetical protein TNCV_4123601 [Trichonephila clavipes]